MTINLAAFLFDSCNGEKERVRRCLCKNAEWRAMVHGFFAEHQFGWVCTVFAPGFVWQKHLANGLWRGNIGDFAYAICLPP